MSKAERGEQLARRIMAGDADAENELIEEYSRGVLFILRRESRNADAVDDLYQESFRVAIEKVRAGDLRDPRKLGSFIISIARFVTIDYYRRESKHDNKDDIEETYHLTGSRDGQLSELMRKERADLARRVISELRSERDRRLLFRYYIAQADKNELCDELDLTPLHFNRVLHRAKQRYRELFLQAAERLERTTGGAD